ncbi:MAG: endonuclease/exonuclease/phosphatase family protein [Acidobacteriota bacterium]
MPTALKLVTYNIHKCKGIDGRVSASRIVRVLEEIDADVIALQEVHNYKSAEDERQQADFIAKALGMRCISGPNIVNDTYEYGNIVLTRLPIVLHHNHNISVGRREPRGCLQVDIQLGNSLIHIFNAHFGTAYRERVRQAHTLFEAKILAGLAGSRILLGDFNDWFPGQASRLLSRRLQDASYGVLRGWRKRTHPCLLPLFKLDRIFYEPSLQLRHSYVHRSRLARIASDHLPLVAQLELPTASLGSQT